MAELAEFAWKIVNSNYIATLSDNLGAGERSVRLLLSLLGGYPLAFLYRAFLHSQSVTLKHVFFISTGMLLCYFNFGAGLLHSLCNIVSIWLLLKVLGGSALSVAIAFIFNTSYLISSYYYVSGDDYDISWSTPHCVLTLRLIGVVFDLYDGQQSRDNLSADQRQTALDNAPSFIEMLSHTYYFGGFLVGPQFSMKRYQSFVTNKYTEQHNPGPPRNVSQAMGRLVLGIVYVAVFQVMSGYFFTDQYMLTTEFDNLSLVAKLAYILFWGKFTICKYIGCWLLVEGSCMLTGLTHNGKDVNGNTLWNGCTNVRVYEVETFTNFKELVSSFNVNTNNWMAKYVFKRCKWAGNRHISQVVTLFYLALWHGLHSGYYMNFFLEFLMLNTEAQILNLQKRVPSMPSLTDNFICKTIMWIVKKVISQFALSYALVSFVHLKWDKYSQVYGAVFYIGHVTCIILPVVCIVLAICLKKISPSARASSAHATSAHAMPVHVTPSSAPLNHADANMNGNAHTGTQVEQVETKKTQ